MDKSLLRTLNKFSTNPNLFFYRDSTAKLANLAASPDLHLLFTGISGCGKLANAVYLLQHNPFGIKRCDLAIFKSYDNKPTRSDEIRIDKILYYDNIFLIDFEIIPSSELNAYFDFISNLSETSNIDGRKKIIIGRHVDALPTVFQKRLGDAMEKASSLFWLTSAYPGFINNKITASSAIIRITPFTYEDFIKIDYWRLGKIYRKAVEIAVSAMYSVYVNNNYNWGLTIAHIKWSLQQMQAGKFKEIDIIPIQNKLIIPIIKKYSKLTSIIKLEDIRTHLMGLLSINMSPHMIVNLATQHYLNTRVKPEIKRQIVELAASSSRLLAQTEKHLPILENFFFQIINCYFST